MIGSWDTTSVGNGDSAPTLNMKFEANPNPYQILTYPPSRRGGGTSTFSNTGHNTTPVFPAPLPRPPDFRARGGRPFEIALRVKNPK